MSTYAIHLTNGATATVEAYRLVVEYGCLVLSTDNGTAAFKNWAWVEPEDAEIQWEQPEPAPEKPFNLPFA
jgi:hypothetical protein